MTHSVQDLPTSPARNPLLEHSALELARGLRAGQFDALEVLEAHIERIEAVNPLLNALVHARFDEARREAKQAAQRLATESNPPPLLGVPCTIKEFIGVQGMPQTAGVTLRRSRTATEHAPLVQRLIDAGAIVMGVTNAPEGGLWFETNNRVYGRTSNPWDLYRSPGGSSGGEGALIAAGGSVFGLGSDTGGSIRLPAGFCGIVGHKPTGGLLPNTGHFPDPPDIAIPMMTCGPMTRRVEDLMPLLRILAGPDGKDPLCTPMELGDPDEVDVSKLTVYPVPTNGRFRAQAAVRDAIDQATQALVARGARVGRLTAPYLAEGFEMWAAMLSESNSSYDHVVGNGHPIALWRQLARFPRGRSDHTGSVLLLLLLEKLTGQMQQTSHVLLQRAKVLRSWLDATLGKNGVLLHPVFPRPAPRHRATMLGNPTNAASTTLFNVTASPVTVVPVLRDPIHDLPVCVQIVGARGMDHLTIATAAALEEAFGTMSPTTPRWGKPAPLGIRLVADPTHNR